MPNSQLEHLRKFAASARSGGFNVPIFRLDGNSEYRRVGKNAKADDMNGQQLAADPGDAMTGWQQFKDNVPIYCLGRVADGYQPPEREELGPLNPTDKKDPWARIDLLPFWDTESREVLLFSADNLGSRDAVANLIGAYADNAAAHPEDSGKVPLIELATDSYENQHGKQIYIPVFEILSWIERPDAVRRVLPPPVKALDLKALPPAQSNQHVPVVAKAKKSAAHTDMEEMPF
jgi:hypothetical protein